jgi:hypothetical protein
VQVIEKPWDEFGTILKQGEPMSITTTIIALRAL